MSNDATIQPSGGWPDLPCPPGANMTARGKLQEIFDLAVADQQEDVEQLAIACRDVHGTGPRHQGEALDPLGEVHRAWKSARQAAAESRPPRKRAFWLSCRNELEHTP